VPQGVQARFPDDQLLSSMHVESYMGSPLVDREGNVCGIIAVMDTRPMRDETALDALDVLRVFSSRAALEVERVKTIAALERSLAERDDALERLAAMVQQFKVLTARREKIREQERTRVAKEVHDELGQQLTLIKFEHARVRRALKSGQDVEQILADFPTIIDRAIETVRRIATELRPGILDNFGLAATLEWQAEQFSRRTGIECRFSEVTDISSDSNVSTALFRIFQEALTNVARHSGATRVVAALRRDDGRSAVLEVSDNGRGIDETALRGLNTTGLLGMRERAEMLGGTLLIENNSNGGARIVAVVPVGAASGSAAGGMA
jgi:signal transduction histidine kinase